MKRLTKRILFVLMIVFALVGFTGCAIAATPYETDGSTLADYENLPLSGVLKVDISTTNSAYADVYELFNDKLETDFSVDNSIIMNTTVVKGYFVPTSGGSQIEITGYAEMTVAESGYIEGNLIFPYSGLESNTTYEFNFWFDIYVKADASSTSCDLHTSLGSTDSPQSASGTYTTVHVCHGITFDKKLDSNFTGGALTTGNYVLTEDITLTDDISVENGEVVNICLNGHAIYNDGFRPDNTINGTLMICDCSDVERYWKRVTSTYTVYQEVAKEEAEFTSKGGLISSRTVDNSRFGRLFGVSSTGSITFDGVNFIGIYSTSGAQLSVQDNGTLNIKNCVVMGNDSIVSKQDNTFISVAYNGNCYITDTVFSDNESLNIIKVYSDKLRFGSNVIIKDNYVDMSDKSKNEIGLTVVAKTVSFDDDAKNNNICVAVWDNVNISTNTMVPFTKPSSKDLSSFFRISDYDYESGATSLRNYITKYSGESEQAFYIKNKKVGENSYQVYVARKYKVIYKIVEFGITIVDDNKYFVGDEVKIKSHGVINGKFVHYWVDFASNIYEQDETIKFGVYNNLELIAIMWPATLNFSPEKNAFVFEQDKDIVYSGIDKKYYSYDAKANLLTLKNGFSYDCYDQLALILDGINVKIEGNVSLSSTDKAFTFANGTMIGNGTLNIQGKADFDNAVINGPTIIATSDTYEAVENDYDLQLISGKIICKNTSTTPYPAFEQHTGTVGNFLVYYKNGNNLVLSELVKTTSHASDDVQASGYESGGIFTPETYVELHPLKLITKPTKHNNYTIVTSPQATSYEWYKVVNELTPITTDDMDYGVYEDYAPVDGKLPCPEMGLIAIKQSVYDTAKKIQITTELNLYDGLTGELASRTKQGDKYIYIFDIMEGIIDVPAIYFYTEEVTEIDLADIQLLKDIELVEITTEGTFTPSEEGDYYCIARLNYGYADSSRDYSIRIVPTAIEGNLFKSISLISLAIGASYIITRKKDNE